MRHFFLLPLLLCCVVVVHLPAAEFDINGRWHARTMGTVFFHFFKDGTVSILADEGLKEPYQVKTTYTVEEGDQDSVLYLTIDIPVKYKKGDKVAIRIKVGILGPHTIAFQGAEDIYGSGRREEISRRHDIVMTRVQ